MKIAIIGSGIYGATIAALLKYRHDITVFEKRSHVGGNVFTTFTPELGHVSEYGAHIFHTNSDQVWQFINQYASFNSYQHYVIGQLPDGRHVDLPFNLSMFETLIGISTPAELQNYLTSLPPKPEGAQDLESHCISMVGYPAYRDIVKNYTEKQWGRPCSQLPKSIIERLPIRLTRDRTYFRNAVYQGMPKNGYTAIIKDMMSGTSLVTEDVDSNALRQLLVSYDHVFFSGALDRLFDYSLGFLPYRGLRFEHRVVSEHEAQGAPVINDLTTSPKTRTIEHRLFYPDLNLQSSKLILTDEYPSVAGKYDEPYYPIRDAESSAIHDQYMELAASMYKNLTVGGRLGSYRYYDMDQVIGMAMKDAKAFQ